MIIGRWRTAILAAIVATSVCTVTACSAMTQDSAVGEPETSSPAVFQMAAIQPDSGRQPILDFISSARSTLDVVMYQFNDDVLVDALASAAKSGVKVRVILTWQLYLANNNRTDPKAANFNADTPTFNALKAAGVDVAWSREEMPYTHQKSMVADAGQPGARAMVMDFNFQPSYYTDAQSPYDPAQAGTRGFALVTSDSRVIDEMTAVFNADFPPYSDGPNLTNPNLVWSPSEPQFAGQPPGNSAARLTSLIADAKKNLDVYMYLSDAGDQQLADVISAAKRGVNVRFVANCGALKPADLSAATAVGIDIRFQPKSQAVPSKFLFIHTKTMIADPGTPDQQAYVGSVNTFLAQSLAQLREVGALVQDDSSVGALEETFTRDFAAGETQCPQVQAQREKLLQVQ